MAPLLFGESIMFPFRDKQAIVPGPISIGNKPNIKVEKDNDDHNTEGDDLNRSVHLCNRCWSTFVGIEAYYAHRNNGCDHSQVFIEGVQRSNNVLDSANTNDKDIPNHTTTNTILACSREIKSEPLETEETQKAQETSNIQKDQEISSVNGGTCYINPNFTSTVQNIHRVYDYGYQPIDKVTQIDQNNSSFSKKRTLNVRSPEQSATSNIQPTKKIKMSESSKELSRELAEILRKQMSAINNEHKDKENSIYGSDLNPHSESIRIKLSESVRSSQELNLAESINAALQKQMEGVNKPNNTLNDNYSESTATNDKEHKDSQNSDLIRKSINPISFQNKYSAAFNYSRPEPTNISQQQTRNINVNSEDCRLKVSDENNNKTFHLKNSNTFSESTYSRTRSFEYNRKSERAYKDCNATRDRVCNFRSNTLVMYNLNIKTRKEWLRKIFQRYGNVRGVKITRHDHVKRAKGYVEFEKLSDAEKAYQLCQKRIIDGSKIKIYCYQYSLDSSPSWIGSGNSEFGKDYEVRSTGYPSRRPIYNRNKRPGPYNLF